MSKLIIWVAVFLLFGSCVGMLKKKGKTLPDCPFKLDKAPESVDDMYDKCEKDSEKKIKTFLRNEINKNMDFKEAWNKAEKYYNSKRTKKTQLKKEQIMALYAYTLNVPPLYYKFNEAVRTKKSEYKTNFQYHTLHFYLTTALRTINPKPENCVTVFRRTDCKFSKPVLNEEIRLGAFSSSSEGNYPKPAFGNQSCFKISTCFGANISKYSSIKSENEVLIPPYEVFKVTAINESSKQNKLPCEVVYTLASTKKPLSNLNCDLIEKKRSDGFN